MTNSPLDMPTLGKVTPAIEGEVTMQQLLDAMAHMAHDIDVLRAQVAAMTDKAGQAVAAATNLTNEAERVYSEYAEHAQRVHEETASVMEVAAAKVEAAAVLTGGEPLPSVEDE